MKTACPTAIPFAGLGLDLSPVAARASLLAPHRWQWTMPASPTVPTVRCVPAPSGYALLLELSREIRGR